MVYFLTLRPAKCKKNRDIKKLVRPIKRALHSCNYAAELHPTNKDRKRDLHLHILIEAKNIEYFKNRLLFSWMMGEASSFNMLILSIKYFHTCSDKVMQSLFIIKVI